jgi:hypothetical protein
MKDPYGRIQFTVVARRGQLSIDTFDGKTRSFATEYLRRSVFQGSAGARPRYPKVRLISGTAEDRRRAPFAKTCGVHNPETLLSKLKCCRVSLSHFACPNSEDLARAENNLQGIFPEPLRLAFSGYLLKKIGSHVAGDR